MAGIGSTVRGALLALGACGAREEPPATPGSPAAPVALAVDARTAVDAAAVDVVVSITECEAERYVWFAHDGGFLQLECRDGKPRLFDRAADAEAEFSLAAWAQLWRTLFALEYVKLPSSCANAKAGSSSWRVSIRREKSISPWYFDCEALAALPPKHAAVVAAVETAVATAGPGKPVVVKSLSADLDGDGKPEAITIGESTVQVGPHRVPFDHFALAEETTEVRVLDLDRRDRARQLVIVNTASGRLNNEETWVIHSLVPGVGLVATEPIWKPNVSGNGTFVQQVTQCGTRTVVTKRLQTGKLVVVSEKTFGRPTTNCVAD